MDTLFKQIHEAPPDMKTPGRLRRDSAEIETYRFPLPG